MKIIGLSGYAGSGKDTIAGILVEDGYTKISFANGVREYALILNPYFVEGFTYQEIISQIGYENAKRKYPSIREFLVKIGDGGRQIFGDNIWLRTAFKNCNSNLVVVSDVRYRNEAEYIKSLGGEIWMICRSGVGPANAVEEKSIGQIVADRLVNNDGTIDDLRKNM